VRFSVIQKNGKKGLYYARVWVPKELRAAGEPADRTIALKTADKAEAHIRAATLCQEMAANLNRRLLGETIDTTAETYNRALSRIAALGLTYRPAAAMMADGTMFERIDRLITEDPKGKSPETAQALLGTAQKPKLMLSKLVDFYIREKITEYEQKTDWEKTKYRRPLDRAVAIMIDLIGDKPVEDINDEDAIAYEEYFKDQVVLRMREGLFDPKYPKGINPNPKGILADTANKSIGHLRTMIRAHFRRNRIKLQNPLEGITIKGGAKGKKPVEFPAQYIWDHFIAPGTLSTMSEAQRDLIRIVALTGCRPKEIAGILPHHIKLDVPHDKGIYPGKVAVVQIRFEGRSVKNEASERDLVLIDEAYEAIKRHPNGFPQYRNNDNLSAAVNKFFREHGHDKGENGKRVFYSLRHSFEGRMTNADIHNRKAARMMGHSVSEEIGREVYGDDMNLDAKLKILMQIRLPPKSASSSAATTPSSTGDSV
jgi:integrase